MYKNFKSFEGSLCFPVLGQAEQEHVGRKLRQGIHVLRHGTCL